MATDRIKGITIEIGGNTTKLQDAIGDVNKSLKNTQAQLKDVDKLLKLDPGNTELLAQKQRLLGQAVTDTKSKLDTLKEAQKQMNQLDSFTPEQQKEYDALQREIISTESDLKSLEKQTKDNEKAMSAFTKAGNKIKDIGKKVGAVGDKLMPVTAAVTGLAAAAGAAWNEVDEATDGLIKMTGASGEALEDLEKQMRMIATTVPTSFDTASRAIGEVNTRFGLTGDELGDLSAQFVRFAAINDTDVVSSIDNIQKAMAAFNIPASEAYDVMDMLTKASQNSGLSIDSLLSTLSSNQTTFQELGLTLEESIGFISMIETSGAEADAVLSGLKKAMISAAMNGKPLNQTLGELQDSMVNAGSDAEGMQIAIDTFGSKAGPAIYRAVKDGKLNLSDFSGFLEGWEGSTTETFENTLDAPDKLTLVLNNLKLVGSDLATMVLEELTPYIEDLAKAVEGAVTWFSALDDDTKKLILGILGVLLVAGPLLKMIQGISGIIGLIVSHPIIAVILGVVSALVYLYNTSEDFRFAVDLLWSTLQWVATWITNIFMDALEKVRFMFQYLLPYALSVVGDWFTGIWTTLQLIGATISNAFLGAWQKVQFMFQYLLPAAISVVSEWFTGIWTTLSWIGSWIKNTFLDTLEKVRFMFQFLLPTAISVISGWFNDTFGPAIDGVNTYLGNLIGFLKGDFKLDWDLAWGAIVKAFETVWNTIVDIAKTPINGVIDFLNFMIRSIRDGINGLIEGVNTLFTFTVGPIDLPFIGRVMEETPIKLVDLDTISAETWPDELIPKLASGGILSNGSALVGEAGPELLTMQGNRAVVSPLPGSAGYDNSPVLAAIGQVTAEVAALAESMARMQVVMDSGALVGSIAPRMDNTLARSSAYKMRRI